jgi:hypothetical protein
MSGNRGKGRPKGAINKSTASVKAALQNVYAKRGGDAALLAWADENQTEFYKLWGRMLPTEVSGPDGEPLTIQTIERSIRHAQN